MGWASGVRGAEVRVADVPVAFGLGLAVLLGGLTGLNSGVGWLGVGLSLALSCLEPEPSLAVSYLSLRSLPMSMPCPSLRGFRTLSLPCHRLP